MKTSKPFMQEEHYLHKTQCLEVLCNSYNTPLSVYR